MKFKESGLKEVNKQPSSRQGDQEFDRAVREQAIL